MYFKLLPFDYADCAFLLVVYEEMSLERIVAGMRPTGTVTWNETIRCPVDATRATLFHLKRRGERVARRR